MHRIEMGLKKRKFNFLASKKRERKDLNGIEGTRSRMASRKGFSEKEMWKISEEKDTVNSAVMSFKS